MWHTGVHLQADYGILSHQVLKHCLCTYPHFHRFLMKISYFLCTEKKYGLGCISFSCAKNGTLLPLILYFPCYNFLKYKNLKTTLKIITLLSHTVKNIKNIKAYISRTIKDSMKISTHLSSLYLKLRQNLVKLNCQKTRTGKKS